MKFNKILTIGIGTRLDSEYWDKLDAVADKRVDLARDSSDVNKEIYVK